MVLGSALLAWVIGSPAASAGPCETTETPVRCVEHLPAPPRDENYWRRWQQATTTVMAGRRASPIFREPAAAMDAYWRIAAFDRERPWISEEDELLVRESAQVGALMGLEHMVRETFERSESLGVLYRIGSTVSGANLDVSKSGSGRTRVRYNAQAAELRAAEASLEDDATPVRSNGGPRVRTGLAFSLVDGDDSEEVIDPDLTLTAYTELRHLGLDALRLQASEALPEARRSKTDEPDATGRWSATLREGLLPSLEAFFTLRGEEERQWRPSRTSTGLSLRLPLPESWVLRTELSQRFAYEDLVDGSITPAELRVMVRLKANLRWSLPQPWDGWPLGLEPGAQGRPLPEVPGELPWR